MEDLSFDEMVTKIEDAFDASIAPKSIVRSNNNKLHLMFKADAAGYEVLHKTALSLMQRFDPLLCDDTDLEDTARIVGTERRSGKASVVPITVTNTSTVDTVTLYAGVYQFISVDGEVFSFTVALDTSFAPEELFTYYAISANFGAYEVTDILNASVARQDSATINSNFSFSTTANQSYLGFGEESLEDFRKRLTETVERDDTVKEIEEAISALPTIYACNCVFNPLLTPKVYDGITLAAKELLIVVTGIVPDEVAEIVAKYSHYTTHIVDSADVVYYLNSRYIDGKYPVYFTYHDTTDFTVQVEYSYNSGSIKSDQVEAIFDALLRKYQIANTHVDTITERDIYNRLDEDTPQSVTVLNVSLLVSGAEVPYVNVPKTRIPHLTAISYTKTDLKEV